MQQGVIELQNLLKNNNINIRNKNLKKILSKFEIKFYQNLNEIPKEIFMHKEDPKVIIIDEYEEEFKNKYFIICFDYKVIIFQIKSKDEPETSNLNDIFRNIKDYKQYFIGKYKNNLLNEISEEDFIFSREIQKFSIECTIEFEKESINNIWSMIVDCLSGFLIKKGYQNSRNKQKNYFKEEFKEHREKYDPLNKSYIELRQIDGGSGGKVCLIYYISTEEIYALKTPNDDLLRLNEREWKNYKNIRHPFIVHYFGYIEHYKRKYLLLEYVEGQTLDKYLKKRTNLDYVDKCIIILELLITIHYLHSLKYIYQDLKLNNIIINENKDAILIDFDHLIQND